MSQICVLWWTSKVIEQSHDGHIQWGNVSWIPQRHLTRIDRTVINRSDKAQIGMPGIYETAQACNASLKQKERHFMTKNFEQPTESLEDPRDFKEPWSKTWKLYSENWEPSSHIWEPCMKKKKMNLKLCIDSSWEIRSEGLCHAQRHLLFLCRLGCTFKMFKPLKQKSLAL